MDDEGMVKTIPFLLYRKSIEILGKDIQPMRVYYTEVVYNKNYLESE